MKCFTAAMKAFAVLSLATLIGVEPIIAEVPGAMLTTSGGATVNGQPVSGSTVIFAGDSMRITSGTAVLRPKDLLAVLDADTQATYSTRHGNDALTVANGSGTIDLRSKNASVTYLGLTVVPRNATAKVVIGLEHGRRALMASGGPLLVTNGIRSMVLEPGSALVQQATPPPQPPAQPGDAQPSAQIPPPVPAQTPQQTAPEAATTTQSDDYCSEENQNKDKKRRKKCAPAAAFEGFNLVRDAIIAAAILGAALYGFGAFSGTNQCTSPTQPGGCPKP